MRLASTAVSNLYFKDQVIKNIIRNSNVVFGTSFLLHFDSNYNDSSFSKVPMTFDAASISTTDKKFGAGSAAFGGYNVLLYQNTPAFNFGANNFTIEFWFKYASFSNSTGIIFSSSGITINLPDPSSNKIYASVPSYITNLLVGNVTDTLWHHYAVVRNGINLLTFTDGQLISTNNNLSTNSLAYNPNTSVSIGGSFDTNRSPSGLLDELRVTKGLARYTSSFTPPTEAFTF